MFWSILGFQISIGVEMQASAERTAPAESFVSRISGFQESPYQTQPFFL